MIFTPHPLRERMTLFWHDHFATSIAKVQQPGLMQRQNDLLRSQALGDFRALLEAIGKDPAMLIWLDSTANRRRSPNENYAREVMELFSLGPGPLLREGRPGGRPGVHRLVRRSATGSR